MADFTITVTDREAQIIGAGLDELPYKIAAPLLAKLQAQITEQVKAHEAAAKVEPVASKAVATVPKKRLGRPKKVKGNGASNAQVEGQALAP